MCPELVKIRTQHISDEVSCQKLGQFGTCQKLVRASCARTSSDSNVPHELVQTSRVKNWSIGHVSKTSPGVMCQEVVRLSNANIKGGRGVMYMEFIGF